MRLINGRLSSSPTDFANFLACRHKTSLDLLVAHENLARPQCAIERQMTPADVLVVAPYNAQLANVLCRYREMAQANL